MMEPFDEEYNAMARAENERARKILDEAHKLKLQGHERIARGDRQGAANDFAQAKQLIQGIHATFRYWRDWRRQFGYK